MAAAADPAKTAPFRDRFARVAFNAFAITRPIYVFQGARRIVRCNMRLSQNPARSTKVPGRWLSNHDWSVCGGELVVNLTAGDLMLPSSPMAKV